MIHADAHIISSVVAAICVALPAAQAIAPETPCPSDLTCEGSINGLDLALLLGAWGPCSASGSVACAADLDDSGHVNGMDLATLLAQWGSCQFQFAAHPNLEADWLVLELLGPGGPLIAPEALYARVDRDMTLIREAMPALTLVTHTPAWATNRLLVEFPLRSISSRGDAAPAPTFQCLSNFYQVESMEPVGVPTPTSQWFMIHFPGTLNMARLKTIFTDAPDVILAEPDNVIFRPNKWVFTDLGSGTWRWVIDQGYSGCEAGCLCWVRYVFEVEEDGSVHALSCDDTFGQFCPGSLPGAPGCAF